MGLNMWETQLDLMNRWRGARLSDEQFEQILAETVCAKSGKAAEMGHAKPVNERLFNYLMHQFNAEKQELGSTMWAGYNALTHWATHTDETIEKEIDNKLVKIRSGKSTADVPSVQRTRNDEVRQVIECESWKEMETA